MTHSAIMLADSINKQGKRMRTFQVRYPLNVHAEELTHRIISTSPQLMIYVPDGVMYDADLSRNASSSRAIPTARLIEDLIKDPVMPIYWGANQKGMQASEECDTLVDIGPMMGLKHPHMVKREIAWVYGMLTMTKLAEAFANAGYHKQLVNRLLKPWQHINVVISGTEFENFYALRRHADADPEIQALAEAMWQAEQASTPKLMEPGTWHLPYVTDDDIDSAIKLTQVGRVTRDMPDWDREVLPILIKVSVARCARVSYKTHDGRDTTVEEDAALYDRLIDRIPLHASPAEHQATPDRVVEGHLGPYGEWKPTRWMMPHQHGNLKGWCQYRKMLPNECVFG